MTYIPEFIKYRIQCGFAVGIMLITPIATFLLDVLTLVDKKIQLGYGFIIIIIDLLLAIAGFRVIIMTHHYLLEKEIKYAMDN